MDNNKEITGQQLDENLQHSIDERELIEARQKDPDFPRLQELFETGSVYNFKKFNELKLQDPDLANKLVRKAVAYKMLSDKTFIAQQAVKAIPMELHDVIVKHKAQQLTQEEAEL